MKALKSIYSWLAARRYGLVALAIILGAALIRVGLAHAGWPGTDSDDSTMGLMALHILTRGEHPIFFWGQAYMGTLEAYSGALMFALLGVSVFALKCGLILLYAGFMGVMYFLLARLFSRGWALVGLVVLSLGDDDMFFHQLEAYGGYLETIFFGALMILIALWVMRTAGDAARVGRHRAALFAWGLAAGLGIWSDPLVAPFVGFSALVWALAGAGPRAKAASPPTAESAAEEAKPARVARSARTRLVEWGLAALGLLLGLSPWPIYFLTAANPVAATSFLQRLPRAGDVGATVAHSPLQDLLYHILGVVFISLPNKTGAIPLCPVSSSAAWPPGHWTTPAIWGCMAFRGVWGTGFLVLLTLAAALEARAFWRARRVGPTYRTPAERAAIARAGGRLVALVAPGATIILYAISSSSASQPWMYSRYLISTAIALPVILASLYDHAHAHALRRAASVDTPMPPARGAWRARLRAAGGQVSALRGGWARAGWARGGMVVLTVALVGTLALGTVATYQEIPAQVAANASQNDLVRALLQRGDTRIYAPFWTCYRASFESGEQIVCSVVNAQFEHLPSRYAPYDAIVHAAPQAVFVFPLPNAGYVKAFIPYAAQRGWRLDTTNVDGQFVIFRVLNASAARAFG